ncbi:amino acid ABC transporter permease [Acidocella sp.]|uniref:amino acid ABC transporter permease n=1 Tax=Acidocella sp. TaxID=50710 RepID=UPI003D00165F
MSEYDFISMLQGLWVTLTVSLAAICIGIPCGLGLALIRWRGVPFLSLFVAALVSLLRAVPSVTLALLIYFALPVWGISPSRMEAAIVVLALGTMAFDCEIWRSGLRAFPKDQLESAVAFGMPRGLRFRRIVLPQLIRTCLPALMNEATLIIKVSPAVAVIGLVDTTRAAVRVGAETYQPLPPFFVALLLYVALIGALLVAQRFVARRFGASS